MTTRARPQPPLRRVCGGLRRWVLGLGLAVAFVAFAVSSKPAQSAPDFVVIVNAKNRTESASRELVADAFLKKTTRWSDGETIRPVDQSPDAEVRKRFSKAVLKKSVAAVRSYWQQKIFAGRGVPPPELDSDEAVVKYVQKHEGAIGYVSPGVELGTARPLPIR
jgi:ABC-type phosphate transport system substrate-binding protein